MKKVIEGIKNFNMDKRTSAYIIMSFTVVCLLVTIFIATNDMKYSYSAEPTATSNAAPSSLTWSGEATTWSYGDLELRYDFKGSDGTNTYDMYCIEKHNDRIGAADSAFTLNDNPIDSRYTTNISSGLVWLLDNAYPSNLSSVYMSGFTTTAEKKLVTQWAIWYYLDQYTPNDSAAYTDDDGNTYTKQLTDDELASITAQSNVYTKAVYDLAMAAKTYNDTHQTDATLDLYAEGGLDYTIKGDYIESSKIIVGSNKEEQLKSFTVSIAGNEYDAQLIDANGVAMDTLTFSSLKDSFSIRIPLAKIKDLEKFNLPLSITGEFKDSIYFYNETTGSGQKPIIATDVTTSHNYSFTIPLAKITKTDITTGEALSGATLTIKDSSGEEVATWVTDGNPHYVSLQAGTYTLTETATPEGYELNKESITFEVKDDGIVVNVEMKNTPITVVPDTAENIPTYVYLIGLMIIIIGGVVIYEAIKPKSKK